MENLQLACRVPNQFSNFLFYSFITHTYKRVCDSSQCITSYFSFADADSLPDPTTQGTLDTTDAHLLDNENPICADLVHCTENISYISEDLASPMFSNKLLEELQKKNINTIGDLAKLSELEISRLSVRPPKISTIKDVLAVYNKSRFEISDIDIEVVEADDEECVIQTHGNEDGSKVNTDYIEKVKHALNHVADEIDTMTNSECDSLQPRLMELQTQMLELVTRLMGLQNLLYQRKNKS